MSVEAIALILILVSIVSPIGWIVSEFKFGQRARVSFAILSILSCFVFAYAIGQLCGGFMAFTYNASYGRATKELIKTTLAQIEDGQIERVIKVFRSLNTQYNPSYQEDRSNYIKLVSDATSHMRGETGNKDNSKWDVEPFGIDTWIGHWENDTGFWIVISRSVVDKAPYEIIRSGHPETKMSSVSVSDDYRTLKFQDAYNMQHTLKLVNKYEAIQEWKDLDNKTRDSQDHLFKLTRPTEDQKRVTGQIIQGIPTNRSSQP